MARNPLLKMPEIRKLQGKHPSNLPGLGFGQFFFKDRPEHVALIGKCLMTWPVAEASMAVLLATLLRADTDSIIAVYQLLRRSTAKHAAVEQAATHALDAAGHDLIKALLSHSQSVERDRNDLAHAFWGICFEIDDGIAWVPQEHMTLTHVDYYRALVKDQKPAADEKISEKLRESTFVYRKSDLQAIYQRINDLVFITNEFRAQISRLKGPAPITLPPQSMDVLKSFSQIQEVLKLQKM